MSECWWACWDWRRIWDCRSKDWWKVERWCVCEGAALLVTNCTLVKRLFGPACCGGELPCAFWESCSYSRRWSSGVPSALEAD